MDKKDELIYVGKYNSKFNEILGIELQELNIFQSEGLSIHMRKRNHDNCIGYIERIPEIINNPDYIGINPNESDTSFELIKRYDDNVLIGIKLDIEGNYFYISTMHEIQEQKISRRLFSGRLKEVAFDNEDEK